MMAHLKDTLAPPAYAPLESVLIHAYTLLHFLFALTRSLTRSIVYDTVDATRLVNPFLTFLVTYAALLSFYRVSRYMTKVLFVTFAWVALVAALGAAVGRDRNLGGEFLKWWGERNGTMEGSKGVEWIGREMIREIAEWQKYGRESGRGLRGHK